MNLNKIFMFDMGRILWVSWNSNEWNNWMLLLGVSSEYILTACLFI
jgi:hypothetical protein